MYNWTPYNTSSIKGPKLDYIILASIFYSSKLDILNSSRLAPISFLPTEIAIALSSCLNPKPDIRTTAHNFLLISTF